MKFSFIWGNLNRSFTKECTVRLCFKSPKNEYTLEVSEFNVVIDPNSFSIVYKSNKACVGCSPVLSPI